MARHVADAAVVYAVLSGTDVPDLRADALTGKRLAVWRSPTADTATGAVFDDALVALTAAGASVVEVEVNSAPIEASEWPALLTEFRHEIDAYLADAPGAQVRSLAALVEFNAADPAELAHFGQTIFEQALAAPGIDDPIYRRHRANATQQARAILDRALDGVDALVTLTNDPAWAIDYEVGDVYRVETTTPAAVAGYPSITVPAGFVGALPVGLSLIGRAGDDAALWQLAYGFEHATRARRPPGYLASAD